MTKKFIASMLAKGNHVFQASITILDNGIKVRIPGFWRNNETFLNFDEIKGIELTTPSWYSVLTYSTVQFYARGIRVEAHGFTKSDALQIKRLIEEGQKGNKSSSSSPYSNMSKQEREIKEQEIISRIDQKKHEREIAILDEQLKAAFEGYQKGEIFLNELIEKAYKNVDRFRLLYIDKLQNDITPHYTNLLTCYYKQLMLIKLIKVNLSLIQSNCTTVIQNHLIDYKNFIIKKKDKSKSNFEKFTLSLEDIIEEADFIKQEIDKVVNSEFWETSKNQKEKAELIRKLLPGGIALEQFNEIMSEISSLYDSCDDSTNDFFECTNYLYLLEASIKNVNSTDKKTFDRLSEILEIIRELHKVNYRGLRGEFENEDLSKYLN